MATHVFQIETGKFGLSKVDTADTGYLSTWQSPNGVDVASAVIANYSAATPGGDFSCQISSGALSSSPQTTTDSTPATFCSPEETTTSVGVTSYSLDVTFLQDPDVMAGLNRYLFEWDTFELYFYLGLNADAAPKAIGRCRAIAGTIGGDARTKLTATLSLPLSRKPDILFGSGVSTAPIELYA
jgi:hypothetical protein